MFQCERVCVTTRSDINFLYDQNKTFPAKFETHQPLNTVPFVHFHDSPCFLLNPIQCINVPMCFFKNSFNKNETTFWYIYILGAFSKHAFSLSDSVYGSNRLTKPGSPQRAPSVMHETYLYIILVWGSC